MPARDRQPYDALLARVAGERFRWCSSIVFAQQVLALVASHDSLAIVLARVIALCLVVVLALAPDRPLARLLVLWWLPVAVTLLSQALDGGRAVIGHLFIELVCVALLLETKGLAISLAGVLALELPLVYAQRADSTLLTCVFVTALAFGFALHVAARRSLITGETLRVEALAAEEEARKCLLELERSSRERRELQDKLFHKQRLQAIGTLAAGIAHDMNNVLAAIAMNAQALSLDQPVRGERWLERIVDTTKRGGELTHNLLSFSEKGQYRKEPLSAAALLQDAVAIAQQARTSHASFDVSIDPLAIPIEGDRVRITQAISNLCINALDAMNGAGTLKATLAMRNVDASLASELEIDAGPHACFEITDHGTGMDEATLSRIFEPFFTTKSAGEGTGLGLSMVWGVVRAHRGAVRVASSLGAGSTFTVLLPVHIAPASTAAPPRYLARQTILVVDDEPGVRSGTKRFLERAGYDVLVAADGAAALELFAQHESAIGVVILDMGMPMMGGAECFERLRQRSKVPVIIATGYASSDQTQVLVDRGATLLEKPYASADLRAHIERLLGTAVVIANPADDSISKM